MLQPSIAIYSKCTLGDKNATHLHFISESKFHANKGIHEKKVESES